MLPSPLEALSLPFMRVALGEILLLAVAGGVLGAWIVLRRLAFFTHAVGSAVFPALVVAGPVGVAPQVAGLAAGLGYAAGVERTARSGRDATTATGLLLVACLAGGVVLASDVVDAPAAVDRLLFGTLLGLGGSDLLHSAAAAAAALAATLFAGGAWLAAGFEPASARALGVPVAALDALLLMLIAAAAVAAVPAVGALLVGSLFVVPAAAARLLTSSVRGLILTAVSLAAAQGSVGLYLAYAADVSPGPAVAALGAVMYAVALLAARSRGR